MSDDFCPHCGQLMPLGKRAEARWAKQWETGLCGVCGKEDPHIHFNGQGFHNDDTGEISPWMCAECAREWPKR